MDIKKKRGRANIILRENARELRLLQEISSKLGKGEKFEEIIRTISKGMMSIYNYNYVDFIQLTESGNNLIYKYHSAASKLGRDIEQALGINIAGYNIPLFKGSRLKAVIDSKEPFFSKGYQDTLRALRDFFEKDEIKEASSIIPEIGKFTYMMILPLFLNDNVIGLLHIGSKKKLTKRGLERIKGFTTQICIAMEKVIMEEVQHEMQMELMRQNKFSAIGLLIQGIIHNMNSPLTRMLNRSEYLIKWLEMKKEETTKLSKNIKNNHFDQKLEEYGKIIREVELIFDDIDVLSNIVANLTHKGQQEQTAQPQWIDINGLLKEELQFYEGDMFFKHKVEKKYIFDESIPYIKAVYSDLSQSFTNIIKNSLEAMQNTEQKKLTITTTYDEDSICFTVHDTGCGIKKEFIDKILDPSFTTKSLALNYKSPVRAGLGLHAIHTLLGPYRAKLKVKSKPGNTSFSVHLHNRDDLAIAGTARNKGVETGFLN